MVAPPDAVVAAALLRQLCLLEPRQHVPAFNGFGASIEPARPAERVWQRCLSSACNRKAPIDIRSFAKGA